MTLTLNTIISNLDDEVIAFFLPEYISDPASRRDLPLEWYREPVAIRLERNVATITWTLNGQERTTTKQLAPQEVADLLDNVNTLHEPYTRPVRPMLSDTEALGFIHRLQGNED